jgi:hypothetical protein
MEESRTKGLGRFPTKSSVTLVRQLPRCVAPSLIPQDNLLIARRTLIERHVCHERPLLPLHRHFSPQSNTMGAPLAVAFLWLVTLSHNLSLLLAEHITALWICGHPPLIGSLQPLVEFVLALETHLIPSSRSVHLTSRFSSISASEIPIPINVLHYNWRTSCHVDSKLCILKQTTDLQELRAISPLLHLSLLR